MTPDLAKARAWIARFTSAESKSGDWTGADETLAAFDALAERERVASTRADQAEKERDVYATHIVAVAEARVASLETALRLVPCDEEHVPGHIEPRGTYAIYMTGHAIKAFREALAAVASAGDE